jgi:hypothetical protein
MLRPWPWQTIGCCFASWWWSVPTCMILKLNALVSILPTCYFYEMTLWPWPLTLKSNTVLPLIMVMKCTKLYDPAAYGSVSILPTRFFYKVMLRSWLLTPDLEKHGNEMYQIIWSCSLRLGFYPAYKIFLQSYATILTFDPWPWKALGSSSHSDQVYQVVWSCNLRYMQILSCLPGPDSQTDRQTDVFIRVYNIQLWTYYLLNMLCYWPENHILTEASSITVLLYNKIHVLVNQ